MIRPLWIACTAVLVSLTLFGVWAARAPLASTLYLSGKLVSSRPSVDVQHAYGGQVSEVLVRKHQEITAGDVLMRLETRLALVQRDLIVRARSQKQAENRLIQAILAGQFDAREPGPFPKDAAFVLQLERLAAQERFQVRKEENLSERLRVLRDKMRHLGDQMAISQDRLAAQAALVERGIVTRVAQEQLEDQVLATQQDLEQERAAVLAIESQMMEERQDLVREEMAFREMLSATHAENQRALIDLDQNLAGLDDQIAKSDVRAPIDGVVTHIATPAAGMYAARGATLVSLAQSLEQPKVSFTVPVGFVDQLAVGMRGKLVIPGLPQRSMPRIEVTVAAISPKAELDEAGNPVAYAGEGMIEPDGLRRIAEAYDGVALAEDMTVNLLISARETTLFQYLFEPVIENFQNALQD